MFKFSLRLCIWLVLLVGSVLGLVLDREPWVFEEKAYTQDEFSHAVPKDWSARGNLYYAPDGTRRFNMWEEYPNPTLPIFEDVKLDTQMMVVPLRDKLPMAFIDDDTFALYKGEPARGEEIHFFFLHRRFPEWWWGIFYRPLFWIAVVVFFGTVFEFVSMRKRLRTG